MSEIYEALKGFTDIPIAVLSLVFGIILSHNETSKKRAPIFFLLSVSAFAGAAVHILDLKDFYKKLVWIFLYMLLFETVRHFGNFLCEFISNDKNDGHYIYAAESVLYILAVVFMLFVNKFDMIFFILFGALQIIRIALCAFKVKRVPKLAILLFVSLIFPILLQAFESFIPYAVVIEHLILTADLCIVFFMAKNMK